MKETNFKDVYDNYADMVYNLCLNYLQNSTDAEDVCQNVFIKVHKNLSNFAGKSSIKTWIYRVTINQCHDYIKSRKRKKRFGHVVSLFQENKADSSLPLPDFKHPGVLLEDKEALEAIFRKINVLPQKQKTALLLKSIDGLSQKEIADVMEISTKAVESLLSRARSNLKKKLSGD